MTWWEVAGAYGVPWLFTSRALYGRIRLHAKTAVEGRPYNSRADPPARRAPGQPDGLIAVVSMAACAFWPVVLASFFVAWKPPLTLKEREELLQAREAEVERQRRYTADLERQLGIEAPREGTWR